MIKATDSDIISVWVSEDRLFLTILDKIGSDWSEPGSILVFYNPDQEGTMDELPASGCALLIV